MDCVLPAGAAFSMRGMRAASTYAVRAGWRNVKADDLCRRHKGDFFYGEALPSQNPRIGK
jgi:hypothetical protein